MKNIFLTFLLSITLFSSAQKEVIELFREGKTKKILKWIDKNPEGIVDVLAADIERAVNSFESEHTCYVSEMSILELAIIYGNEVVINRAMLIPAIRNDNALVTQALNTAIVKDDIQLVKKLMDLGADLHAYCNFCHNRTSFQVALGNGASEELIELILKDISDEELLHTDCSGMTTLEFLASYKNAKYLKQFYPKLKEQLFVFDQEGNSPFAQAIYNGNLANARFLLNKIIQQGSEEEIEKVIYGKIDDGIFDLDYISSSLDNQAIKNFYDSTFKALYSEVELSMKRTKGYDQIIYSYNMYFEKYYNDGIFPEKVQNAFDFINDALGTDLNVEKNYLKDKEVMPPYEFVYYKDLLSNKHLLETIKEHVSEEQYELFKQNHFDQFSYLDMSFIPFSSNQFYMEIELLDEWYGSEFWKNQMVDDLYSEINHIRISSVLELDELNNLEHLFLSADTLSIQIEIDEEGPVTLPNYLFKHPVVNLKGYGNYTVDPKIKLEQSVTVNLYGELNLTDVPEGIKVIKK